MQAKETKLQDIIEGTKQYIVPLFQRTYSWTEKEWDVLWKDLLELCEVDNPRTHFIGSIVNIPTVSVPEGVAKYLLIDGQQRLTTIFVFLALLRNKAKEVLNLEFAEEINNTLLVNPYKKDNDYFKLMPTQVDRETYKSLMREQLYNNENNLARAYTFFERKLKQVNIEHGKLKKIITTYFSVVSIVLDADDNPHLVFESLNAKGRPLTQADLIRNYFFMRIHVDRQEEVYSTYWQPMQERLQDKLTEYIRHFLMRDGSVVKQTDVYYVLKDKVMPANATEYLRELNEFSLYYERLLAPELEPEPELSTLFNRLNTIEVTTAYPLLLIFYSDYSKGSLNKKDLIEILKTLENYLIRRFVCNIPTNQLNKIFPTIIPLVANKISCDTVEALRVELQTRGYPRDSEFQLRFKDSNLYGAGGRANKCKLILEALEEFYQHKETINFDNLTIEHVMPQTLSEWWQKSLGENWDEVHELNLHVIGNLTFTAYNAEMSNDSFPDKKEIYHTSHLEINKYFSSVNQWGKDEIERRGEALAQMAIKIWPYFGHDQTPSSAVLDVKGTTPSELTILGQKFKVESWRDVLENTLNTVAELEPDKFEVIAQNYPRFVGKDEKKFRAIRRLKNGYFIEVNQSAQSIRQFCNRAIDTIELTKDEWNVSVY